MKPDENIVEKTSVFVVHGRNEELRKSMFDFLRTIGLKPIEWSQAIEMTGKGAPFIGDILDSAFEQAQAVVVLFTGDDEARLRSEYHTDRTPQFEKTLTPQSRPNVLFEAGLALGRFPERTIIVEIGDLRPFSDIAGRHIVRLNNSTKSRQDVASRLKTAGCNVDLSGTDWHDTGNFEHTTTLELHNDESTSSLDTKFSQTHIKILDTLKKSSSTLVGMSKKFELTQIVLLPLMQDLLDQKLISKSAEEIRDSHFRLTEAGVRFLTSLGKL